MIVKEYFRTRKDGVKLYRTYSKAGVKIQKLGKEEYYDEAIDVESATFVYVETDMLIQTEKSEQA